MRCGFLVVISLLAFGFSIGKAEDAEEDVHMREELGVNEFTTPSIRWLLVEFETFVPISMDYVDVEHRDYTYPNRVQTALHFGSIIADGFIVVMNERRADVREIGRALLRQAKALGVGESLARRSNSLFQMGDAGDWVNLRLELVGAQKDVEEAMMQLHDEQMAHLISLGGWLKGFYAAAQSTASNYSSQRAEGLRNAEIMDYFIDRLDTLHPRLKATELIRLLTSRLKTAHKIVEGAIEQDRALTRSEVEELAALAKEMNDAARAKVDEKGAFVR